MNRLTENSPPAWIEQLAGAVERTLEKRTTKPEATYRLQLEHGRFSFRDAAAIAPYLRELGVSHLYASPYLAARPGSPHGYDVVDHSRLAPELGGEDGFRELVEALRREGLGQIMDIVPNHMGVSTSENAWWKDVLENGPSSPYAHHFDIDWRPVKQELKNKVLLPILGEQYGRVLENGQLRLDYEHGAFVLRYFDFRLPLDPKSYTMILKHQLDELREALEPSPAHEPGQDPLLELESIMTALEYLPEATEAEAERVAERQREKEVIKVRLDRLVTASPEIGEFIHRNLQVFNGDPDHPYSFDLLDELLNAQSYRLSHWKAASDEINYRRFFDINDLAAICMEAPDVFEAAHRLVFELLVRGDVDGLRIDHIDGLYDPTEYLWRLQWGYVRALGRALYEREMEAAAGARRELQPALHAGGASQFPAAGHSGAGPFEGDVAVFLESGRWDDASPLPEWDAIEPHFLKAYHRRLQGPSPMRLFPGIRWSADDAAAPTRDDGLAENGQGEQPIRKPVPAPQQLPLYVVVEKILELEEQLPPEWPMAGTTGYDFLNLVNGLFVDPGGLREILKAYRRFVGEQMTFSEVVYRSKLLILRVAMASELQLLVFRLNRLSERHRRTRDFTLNDLRTALREILACFPVYRTYINSEQITTRDRHFLNVAVMKAKQRNPAIDAALFNFVRDTLLMQQPPGLDEAGRLERDFFVGRFQQVTSPVMAKGVEDTAFYRYFPLASLNEVGGAPARGVVAPELFHHDNTTRLTHRPRSLLGTTSHDTKRTEDVRARINVLSEIPKKWHQALGRWARWNRKYRRSDEGPPAPSRNDEYLFYQSLVGIWPLQPPDQAARRELIERLQKYMEKATHEAKERTSWINPDPDYDQAVRDFVASVLEGDSKSRFLDDFQAFHEQVVDWGLYTALSQALLKFTSPGVPDIYQGQELWDFSLVDPDNRRPVDFERRRKLLAEFRQQVGEDGQELLGFARELGSTPRDERLKLFVTWRALQFRRANPDLFHQGQYRGLEAVGDKARHVCAFALGTGSETGRDRRLAIVVAPRLLAQLTPRSDESQATPPPLGETIWGNTRLTLEDLDAPQLHNLFTGQPCPVERRELPLASVLSDFPVAVLTNVGVHER